MTTIMTKCGKCRVTLPESEYEIKRTGQMYKWCNKCRRVGKYKDKSPYKYDYPYYDGSVKPRTIVTDYIESERYNNLFHTYDLARLEISKLTAKIHEMNETYTAKIHEMNETYIKVYRITSKDKINSIVELIKYIHKHSIGVVNAILLWSSKGQTNIMFDYDYDSNNDNDKLAVLQVKLGDLEKCYSFKKKVLSIDGNVWID